MKISNVKLTGRGQRKQKKLTNGQMAALRLSAMLGPIAALHAKEEFVETGREPDKGIAVKV